MVTPGQGNPVGVPDFIGKKQTDSLDRVVSTINIIAEEKVVGERRFSADGEQLNQVMKLSMDVSTNGNRCWYELSVGLVAEDLFGLLYNKLHLLLSY